MKIKNRYCSYFPTNQPKMETIKEIYNKDFSTVPEGMDLCDYLRNNGYNELAHFLTDNKN